VYRLADDRARDLGERHWLSLKDMNRSGRLKDLGDAGVTAFKIEGRLKNRDYVMNVTRHYRRELDGILDGSVFRRASSGVLVNDFIPDLEKTFNREYTEFFLDGRSGPVGRTQTPKFVGEPLGKASSVSRDRFTLNARVSLAPGDGLTFFDASGALQGTVVNRVQGSTIFPERMAGIERGTPIYRNMDHRFSQSLLKREVTRKIRIRMDLRDTRHGLLLSVEDEDGTHVTRMLESGFSPAKKSEQALDTIRKQLTSLGGTVFACEALEIRTDPIPFAPVSAWNRLRREILELLDRLREEKRPRESRFAVSNNVRYPTDSLSYQGNVLNRKAEAFYRRHGVQRIEPAAEKGLDMSGKKVMTTRYCLQYELGRCRGSRASGVLHDSWILVDRDGKKFRLDFDCANCRMEIVYSGE
jgi:putative protease